MPEMDSTEYDFLRSYDGRPLKLMEVCGTHTAAIFRSGIREYISPKIKLISGPGCPVCVTPTAYIDECVDFAMKPGCALVSFGDMLKVPGSRLSLAGARAEGGRVDIVYSPFDVIKMAVTEPETEFIIAAVGFETTAPAYGLLIEELMRCGIMNVRLLTALKSAITAIEWILTSEKEIDGFICPGHVSVITGTATYHEFAERYNRPFVVAGFEPRHISAAINELVKIAGGPIVENKVVNMYPEVVEDSGNTRAQAAIEKYFAREDTVWRGLGMLAGSGYYLRQEYSGYDAGSRGLDADEGIIAGCSCAAVITGQALPVDCAMFGTICTPLDPQGPCMVSAEGACGIWHSFT